MTNDKTWNWHRDTRPKTFKTALRKLMWDSGFSLTERSLTIASGSTRWEVRDWIDGRSIPNDNEIRDIAGAFCLNRFGRVTCTARNMLFIELRVIARIERASIEAKKNEE